VLVKVRKVSPIDSNRRNETGMYTKCNNSSVTSSFV